MCEYRSFVCDFAFVISQYMPACIAWFPKYMYYQKSLYINDEDPFSLYLKWPINDRRLISQNMETASLGSNSLLKRNHIGGCAWFDIHPSKVPNP